MKVTIGPRDKFPLMSEINMIPLIDVSLVLLIIFMIVTPILVTSQIKINLPQAVSGIASDAEPTKIQITAERNYYVDGQVIHPADLGVTLKNKFAGQQNATLLIEADAAVPFEFVIKAMDEAKLNGAQKLGVAVTGAK